MIIDEYALKARYAPALLTIIIPIMVFNHFFVSAEFSKFVGELMGAKLASNLTISAICLYYFSEFGRIIGENVFEKRYFMEELEMPTTTFLLHSDDTYSSDYKRKFRDRIHSEFGLVLPTAAEEVEDVSAARVRIVQAMALVRKSLRGNEFLHQHNIEYGAMRNAIGGSEVVDWLRKFSTSARDRRCAARPYRGLLQSNTDHPPRWRRESRRIEVHLVILE